MEEYPSDLISKINICIENYEKIHKIIPNRIVVNNDVFDFLNLEAESMLIPEMNSHEEGSYTGRLLNNDKKEKIEVHSLEKLSEKKKSELEELTKKITYPIIFCYCGPVKKFRDPIPYDISLTTEGLTQKLSLTEETTESQ